MRSPILIFIWLIFISGFFISSCEKDEIRKMNNKTNQLKFKESKIDSVSQRSVIIAFKIENLDKNSVQNLGICYNTSGKPTMDESSIAIKPDTSGIATIEGLSPDTEYYYRLYAKIGDAMVYSNDEKFATSPLGSPVVSTSEITDITATSAVCGGKIISNNGSSITAKGICWNQSGEPTMSDNKTDEGTGQDSFTSNLKNLEINTTYYVRAYATNGIGIAYGNEVVFSTQDGLPELVTGEVTNIESTSATCGGNVTDNGGFNVTARGICWNNSPNPTTEDSITIDGSGTGSFTSSLSGLSPSTTYYVRAYAANEAGTAYGDERNFSTEDVLPDLTTEAINNITDTTATSGGNITDNGGFAITARGVCWSISHNPTVSDSHTLDGSGTGSFTSSLTGLSGSTTYYVRAYATNQYGTAYGDEKNFKTQEGLSGTFTDSRDGKTYEWIRIGNKVWMAENLNYDAGSGSMAYDNNASNASTYGRLYTWETASNTCPDGWHLPSDLEWEALAEYISSDRGPYTKFEAHDDGYVDDWNDIGRHLKAINGWSGSGNGTDDYGFSALPGGLYDHINSEFVAALNNGFWWSATEYDNSAWGRQLNASDDTFLRNYFPKDFGLSIRCIKD